MEHVEAVGAGPGGGRVGAWSSAPPAARGSSVASAGVAPGREGPAVGAHVGGPVTGGTGPRVALDRWVSDSAIGGADGGSSGTLVERNAPPGGRRRSEGVGVERARGRRPRRHRRRGRPDLRGRVLLVAGWHGGAGTSTVAAALAREADAVLLAADGPGPAALAGGDDAHLRATLAWADLDPGEVSFDAGLADHLPRVDGVRVLAADTRGGVTCEDPRVGRTARALAGEGVVIDAGRWSRATMLTARTGVVDAVLLVGGGRRSTSVRLAATCGQWPVPVACALAATSGPVDPLLTEAAAGRGDHHRPLLPPVLRIPVRVRRTRVAGGRHATVAARHARRALRGLGVWLDSTLPAGGGDHDEVGGGHG